LTSAAAAASCRWPSPRKALQSSASIRRTTVSGRPRKRAGKGLSNTFFQSADAFTYKTEQPVDAAINWSTSCGYMRDDEKNIQMFNRAYDSLKPGGRFAVQYMLTSDDHTAFDFPGEPQVINGETVQRQNYITYDEEHGMSVSKWVNTYPDGRQEQLPPSKCVFTSPKTLKGFWKSRV